MLVSDIWITISIFFLLTISVSHLQLKIQTRKALIKFFHLFILKKSIFYKDWYIDTHYIYSYLYAMI